MGSCVKQICQCPVVQEHQPPIGSRAAQSQSRYSETSQEALKGFECKQQVTPEHKRLRLRCTMTAFQNKEDALLALLQTI